MLATSSKPVVATKLAAKPAVAAKPAAQASCSSAEAMEAPASFDSLKAAVLQLETVELFKLEKAIMAEIESRCKGAPAKRAATGETPAHLKKYQMWTRYVQTYALANGWEAFVYKQRKKVEGEMTTIEVEMPAAVQVDGAWIVPDSQSAKKPEGEQINLSMAMCLAKQYWSAKERSGTKPEVWQAFEAQFDAGEEIAAVPAAPKPIRKTKEELAAEKLAKEAAHVLQMAANKAQREKERDERRASKAAEKEAEKALKAAAKGKPKAAAVPKWSCPADGMVHDFQWKGVLYYRNHDGQIWQQAADEAMGDWVGMWSDANNDIDDSVADPYADE